MKNQIENNLKALISFITAGDPSLSMTEKIVYQLEKGGVDIIELGVPFSDPMADGPVIQASSERALKKGTSLKDVLALVKKIRHRSKIPLLLMGYYNPIFAYGLSRYAKEAAKAGVNATLVVDLPPEESSDLDRELKKEGIDLIYLLTPTSDDARIKQVARKARGFIYFVSMTGITGAKLQSIFEIKKKIGRIRQLTRLPIVIGFGISTPEQAHQMSLLADGVVVGSALVKLIHQNVAKPSKCLNKVENFARSLRSSIKRDQGLVSSSLNP